MKILIIIALWAALLTVTSPAFAAEPLRHIRIEDPRAQQIAVELKSQGFDVLEGSVSADQLEMIVSVAGLDDLFSAGFSPMILAVGRPFREIMAQRQIDTDVPSGYLDLEGIITAMTTTAESFPDLCQLVDLTETYQTPATIEGRHLYALKISDNVQNDEDEPAFLMVSTHHAREIVTPVLALHAIEQLTTQYGIDPVITSLVNANEIWIAPVWNPDGYTYVFDVDNMWRKNRRVFLEGIGVDQNRNYPHGWYNDCSGSSDPSTEIYKGPSPASEAETQTMIAWSEDRNFAKVIDYHSYGRVVLHGYACWDHPFAGYLEDLATTLAVFAGYEGDHRPPSADGEHFQWQVGQMSALAFLIETQTEFQPTHAEAQAEAAMVWPGTIWLLQQPIPLRGHVTSTVTGAPVAAAISFPGVAFEHDESNTSNEHNGRYHAFLPDGNYTAHFEADGFESLTVDDITVFSGFPNTLDIALTPLLTAVGDDQGIGEGLSVSANPTTGLLSYEITKPDHVRLELYDLRGALVHTLVQEYQPAGRYEISLSGLRRQGQRLASGLYCYRITAGAAVRSGKLTLVR